MGQICGIFPKPIWVSKIDQKLNDEDMQFIYDQSRHSNLTNESSTDTRILDSDAHVMKTIRRNIEKEIREYIDTVILPKDKIEIYITQSWINYNEAGNFHQIHNHPNSLLSGVYYINAVKDKDSIIFINDYSTIRIYSDNYNPFNSANWQIGVETGMILIFPSSLSHTVSVLPSDYKGIRVSLSFNTFIRGNFGNELGSSGLELK